MFSFVARGRGKHYVMPMIERLSLVSVRTVSRRLASKGYQMQDKVAADDEGAQWRKKRVSFSEKFKNRSGRRWKEVLHGVGDFHILTWYPPKMRALWIIKSAKRTIMSKAERKKSKFQELFSTFVRLLMSSFSGLRVLYIFSWCGDRRTLKHFSRNLEARSSSAKNTRRMQSLSRSLASQPPREKC